MARCIWIQPGPSVLTGPTHELKNLSFDTWLLDCHPRLSLSSSLSFRDIIQPIMKPVDLLQGPGHVGPAR